MKIAIGIAAAFLLFLALPSAKAERWHHSVSKDEMTGKLQSYATSPSSSPNEPLAFPYGDVQGWLGFGCDRQDEWAYIGFTDSPNLIDTTPQSGGYSTLSSRIRWDDNVQQVHLLQEWGGRSLHFLDAAAAIANMMKARTVLLELRWFGAGKVYFRFTLEGSAEAIKSARAACRK
jgi:hypothetical protein